MLLDDVKKRSMRYDYNEHTGGFGPAEYVPLSMVFFDGNEGGTVTVDNTFTLAPVNGHMRSPVEMEVVQMFVPFEAIDKVLNPDDPRAGETETARLRLEADQGPVLEDEHAISKAAHIHPVVTAQGLRVSQEIRAAYVAAVNALAKEVYYDAAEWLWDGSFAPSLLSSTALQRMRGVNDPETLIDGAINLAGNVPVKGIGVSEWSSNRGNPQATQVRETGEASATTMTAWRDVKGETLTDPEGQIYVAQDPNNLGFPEIYADLSGASELTLRDLMQSQKLDKVIRDLAVFRQRDPINGEERVARAIMNLSMEVADQPIKLYHKRHMIVPRAERPMDGPSMSEIRSEMGLSHKIASMVPTTELGGVLITFAAAKPIEVFAKQPHPYFSQPRKLKNAIHQLTDFDEELLTRGQLEQAPLANVDDPAMWVGKNQLYFDYRTAGANEAMTVEQQYRSIMWTIEIPAAVSPDNVWYPPMTGDDLYPFADWNGPLVDYTVNTKADIATWLPKGPTPIERLQILQDQPDLVIEPDAT